MRGVPQEIASVARSGRFFLQAAGGAFVALAVWAFAAGAAGGPRAHPGSDADCVRCHALGSGPAEALKVLPAQPGFFARLLGKEPAGGHPGVSCAGAQAADGSLTGCHRPEAGREHLLAVDLAGRPSDELCGRCHGALRAPGGHHPSYKWDKDRDGVAETLVRPQEGQEVFTLYAPGSKPEPLATSPDALVFVAPDDSSTRREVAMPLATVVEIADGAPVTFTGVATCVTCHNPHHGYGVEPGAAGEALDPAVVSRTAGDALLRLRDYDNSLCDACH